MEKKGLDVLLGDQYERRARRLPALLTVFPIALVIGAFFPEKQAAFGVLASTVTAFGLTPLLAQLARDPGRRLQAGLFLAWGGSPTTRLLRHRDALLGAATRARYHQNLAKLVPGFKIPTAKSEALEPEAADDMYQSGTTFLIDATRDHSKFPLVFQENINFGFRRNLLGLRRYGITSASIGTALCIVATAVAWWKDRFPPVQAAYTVVDIFMLVTWIFAITPTWVQTAGDAYARALLGTSDTLASGFARPAPTTSPTGTG